MAKANSKSSTRGQTAGRSRSTAGARTAADNRTNPLLALPLPAQLRDAKPLRTIFREGADRDAYALRVAGDCLSPAIEDGDTVIASPSKPVRVGEICVLFPPTGRPSAKRLLSEMPPADAIHQGIGCVPVVVVEMNNPPKRLGIPAVQITAMHPVVDVVRKDETNSSRGLPAHHFKAGKRAHERRGGQLRVYDVAPEGCYAVRIEGNSFAPSLLTGDFALVRPRRVKPRAGAFVILSYELGVRRDLVKLSPTRCRKVSGSRETVWFIGYDSRPIQLRGPDGTVSQKQGITLGDIVGESNLQKWIVGEVIGVIPLRYAEPANPPAALHDIAARTEAGGAS